MQTPISFMKYCVIIIALFSTMVSGVAQDLCEELSRTIFEDTTTNCGEIGNEFACYGSDTVDATFFEDVGDVFSDTGAFVELSQLHTLRATPFSAEEEEWGIGYFRVGIENSDDPLVIIVAGDVIVENDTGALQNNESNALVAFNFTTGGPSTCTEAPNAVFIQSPDNVEVDLIVNSTPIRIGSTVVLGTVGENTDDTQSQDNVMWIAVIEGSAILNPDTDNAISVPEGSISSVSLTDEDGNNPDNVNVLNTVFVPVLDPVTGEPVLGLDGEPFYRQIPIQAFSEPQEITEDGEGIFSWSNYSFIQNMPPTLLNYEVDIPGVNDEEIPPVVNNSPPPLVDTVIESPVDSAITECGTRNWCNAGEPWGDGRCNDDPAITDWFWNSGWYNAQQECGAIVAIPEEFQGAEQTEPIPDPNAVPGVDCHFLASAFYLDFGGGNFLNYLTGTRGYADSTCSIPPPCCLSYHAVFAYAPGGLGDARSICIQNSFSDASFYTNSVYFCA